MDDTDIHARLTDTPVTRFTSPSELSLAVCTRAHCAVKCAGDMASLTWLLDQNISCLALTCVVLVSREFDAPGHETRARTRSRSNFTAVQRAAFDALGGRCGWDLSLLAGDVLQEFLQTHGITKVCSLPQPLGLTACCMCRKPLFKFDRQW